MEIEKFCLPDRFISFLSNRRDGNSLENYFSIFRSFEQYDLTTMLLNNATGLSDPGGQVWPWALQICFRSGRGSLGADYALHNTKVLSLLEACFDLIAGSSLSMKI